MLYRMFIRYFLEIDAPFQSVEAAPVDDPGSWIPSVARDAGDGGERLLAEVGFDAGHGRIGREVEISIGAPVRFPSQTVLPITWRPASEARLLPVLETDLEVAPLGPARTHLSISARYKPPLGKLGRALDRMLLHRVAEATIKDFMDRAAEKLRPAPMLAG
jgi:hypothetical protein